MDNKQDNSFIGISLRAIVYARETLESLKRREWHNKNQVLFSYIRPRPSHNLNLTKPENIAEFLKKCVTKVK